MPILRSTHSSASTLPVTIAIRGMSPSVRLRGRRVSVVGSALSTHDATLLMVTWRRQRPIWITSGMLAPTGTSRSTKRPSGPVTALTTGEPDVARAAAVARDARREGRDRPRWGCTPRRCRGGRAPSGRASPRCPRWWSTTPALQVARRRQRLVQVVDPPGRAAHARPPAAAAGLRRRAGAALRSPPQPSATGPQLAPAVAQVRGTHRGAPQTLATPPPPQVCPPGRCRTSAVRRSHRTPGRSWPPTLAQVRGTQLRPRPAAARAAHAGATAAAAGGARRAGAAHQQSPAAVGDRTAVGADALAQVRRTHAAPCVRRSPPAPQTLGRPPPPQVWPAGHVPHIRSPPQPSDTGPQVAPALAQVRGTHALLPPPGTPHTLARPPPPQASAPAQVPHISSPPQPSATGPQVAPALAQVRGTHALPPQRPGAPPPPQLWPAGQEPHISSPPQPSETAPQVAPALAQVRGAHAAAASEAPPAPHTPGRPPPPQLCPSGQLPHSSSPPAAVARGAAAHAERRAGARDAARGAAAAAQAPAAAAGLRRRAVAAVKHSAAAVADGSARRARAGAGHQTAAAARDVRDHRVGDGGPVGGAVGRGDHRLVAARGDGGGHHQHSQQGKRGSLHPATIHEKRTPTQPDKAIIPRSDESYQPRNGRLPFISANHRNRLEFSRYADILLPRRDNRYLIHGRCESHPLGASVLMHRHRPRAHRPGAGAA
jgi:hypothetical protein